MKRTHNKKNFYSKWLSAALILSLLIPLAGCGLLGPGKAKGEDELINRVEVTIPNPTAPEAIVSLQGHIALQYYIEARMYLEKLSMINAEEIDSTELTELVNDTITAFENAEKMSVALSSSVDLWMEMGDKREAPRMEVLNTADMSAKASLYDPFALKACAADRSVSEMTAQAIVDAFDKAENGKKLKTLSELLGTDARHAMEQLKIAQATLEGEEAMEVAEKATKCIVVAKTLKTAGTVAGLVIAAAPAATGSIAAMATGEMLATGGGIVMSGVNSTLEIMSTGAALYCGTDENRLTQAADTVSDSDTVQTANTIVGLAGLGYNIKNVFEKLSSMTDAGAVNMKELMSLTANNGKEASDFFGMVSYELSDTEPIAMRLEIFHPYYMKEGIRLILMDTEIGTSPEQQEAMKTLLEEAEFSEEEAEEAVNNAVKIIEEGGNTKEQDKAAETEFSQEEVDSFLKENEWIAPNGDFDIDGYIAEIQEFMENLAAANEAGSLTDAEGNAPGDEAEKGHNTEGGSSGEEKWVNPYEYFGVDNCNDLYAKLKETKPKKIEVTPMSAYVWDGDGTKKDSELSNREPFIIDMTDGAVTTYETRYEAGMLYHELKMTIKAMPDHPNLMIVNCDVYEYWSSDNCLDQERHTAECEIGLGNYMSREKDMAKSIIISTGYIFDINFKVERICF